MGKITDRGLSKMAKKDGEMTLTAFKKPQSFRAYDEKVRNCLMCRDSFVSTWSGERICSRCKKSAAWRSALSES